MKCPKCGKVWNDLNTIASNTYICPFCGDNFGTDGEAREDINQVVKKMVDDYGIEVLEDIHRMNALLMDYAPHSEKERKLIMMVMKEGVLSQLLKLKNEDENNQEFGVNKCVKQLVSDIWITEIAAKYAVSVIANAVGINVSFDYMDETLNGNGNNGNVSTSSATSLEELTKSMDLSTMELINGALAKAGSIGFKALASNRAIEDITIPDSVTTIYPKAFLNCVSMKRIVLPKTLKVMGRCVFEGCSDLEEIIIPEGAPFKVLDGVFIDKANKKTIRALNKKNIDSIGITNGITVVSSKTFDRCSVRQITIPMSVIEIEPNAFYLTMNLEKIVVDPKNMNFRSIDGVIHNRNGKVLIRYPQGKIGVNYYLEDTVEEIGEQAFSCATNIQTLTFTSELRRIGNKAFEYCMGLENLMLPGSVEVIGDRAFQYCDNLRSAMLSRTIREIGDCAFYYCGSLETISVPRSVEKIGNLAFAHCEKLKSVVIQDNVNFIGDGAFVGCPNIEISVKNNPYVETYCRTRGIKFNKI